MRMNKEELKELAATLNGIADGREWEFLRNDRVWSLGNEKVTPVGMVWAGSKIRLKPWSLPPPPEGMQWHRDDWTEEMLEGGWRPHLLGEVDNGDDEFLVAGEWRTGYYGSSVKTVASDHHRRTKAPLPQPDPYAELKAAHAAGKVIQFRFVTENNHSTWRDDKAEQPAFGLAGYEFRIKPEQQKVPLEPSDVPPGSAITAIPDTLGYCFPVVVDEDGCYFASRDDGQDKTVSWEAMVDGWQINRSLPITGKWNPEAWEPCYKLIDTP